MSFHAYASKVNGKAYGCSEGAGGAVIPVVWLPQPPRWATVRSKLVDRRLPADAARWQLPGGEYPACGTAALHTWKAQYYLPVHGALWPRSGVSSKCSSPPFAATSSPRYNPSLMTERDDHDGSPRPADPESRAGFAIPAPPVVYFSSQIPERRQRSSYPARALR